jgi:serine/threonine protein kinase
MNAEKIFHDALARPQAERPAFLAAACGGDEPLQRRLQALLHAHENPGSFLAEQPPLAAATLDDPIAERPGTVIGPYKLMEQIGEGGMGLVFVAEQQHPVRRKVALKIIKPGMDTRQVIARFEAERQALALMDHPNIAKVYDGGTTGAEPDASARGPARLAYASGSAGRPYFVMELVKGVPITEYCDQNQAPVRERLELFLDVCQAVQHAHQKGIIHRDIKPSNVLVMSQDGTPLVKVIDFGVAKAIGQQLTDKTIYTQFTQLIGTPLYMSPEQAGQSGIDVDTRTDIYALGVLLYELLTGTTPFDMERFKDASYEEIRRIIREEEPPKPSTRISTLGNVASTVSTQRRSDPKQLSRLVRGELDWIVMKALEKDRNRRYETANGFAMDVQRYLADEPVLACPPSAAYRLRKFVRRNKAGLVLVASVAAALLAGTIISTWQAIRASNAEQKAQANFEKAREAVKRMLTRVAQEELVDVPWMEPVRKSLLEDALQFYEQLLAEQSADPEIRLATAQAHLSLAWINGRYGDDVKWAAEIQLALELLQPLAKEFPENVRYRAGLASGLHLQAHRTAWEPKRWKEAERLLRRAVELQESVVSATPDSADTAYDLANMVHLLGNALATGGQFEEAEAVYARTVSIGERGTAKDADHPAYLRAQVRGLTGIADMIRQKEPARAEGLLLRAQALAMRFQAARRKTGSLFDTGANTVASVDQGLGELYHAQGRTKDAQAAFRRALAVYQKYSSDFPSLRFYSERLAWASSRLADELTDPADRKEAESCYRTSIEAYEKLAVNGVLGNIGHKGLVRAYRGLGGLLEATDRPGEAEKALRRALSLSLKLSEDSPELENRLSAAWLCNHVGALLERTKRPEEAEQRYRQALQVFQTFSAEHPTVLQYALNVSHTHGRLVNLLRDIGRLEDAETMCQETIKLHEKLVAGFPKELEPRLKLSAAHHDRAVIADAAKRPAEAEAGFRKALDVVEQAASDFPDSARAGEAVGHKARFLGWQYARWNRHADAEMAYAKSVEAFEKASKMPGAATDDCRYLAAHTLQGRAEAILAQKRPKEAEDLFRKAVEDYYMLPGDFLLQKADRHRTVAGGINRYIGFLRSQNKPKEAVAAMQQGIDFYARLGADMPKAGAFREELVDRLQKSAWFLATAANPKDRDGKRAVDLARKAIELAPKQGLCWNTLGVALYRTGAWNDALAALQKSMELRMGGDSLDWFFLAAAQERLGEMQEARRWFEQAVRWMEKNQPNNEELRRFRAETAALLGIEQKKG